MLFWENENPANGAVHHLMVISYHIQHPTLYSPEGLENAKQLLTAFLVAGLSPEEMRQMNRHRVDSGHRTWKIKGTRGNHGVHPYPMTWPITAVDVIAGSSKNYCANVESWARSVHESLQAAAKSHNPG